MRHFILTLLSFLTMTTAVAQDVLVIQRKDGSTARFDNGMYKARLHFWGTPGEGGDQEELRPVINSQPEGFGPLMQVTNCYCNDGRNYYIEIHWNELLPDVPCTLCIATHPGVTVENCDNTYTFEHYDTYFRSSAFVHGTTYYYRLMVRLPCQQQGEQQQVVCYGPEMAFRIPDLMAESGLMPAELATDGAVYPTQETWAAFRAEHFRNTSLSTPDALTLGRLWLQWLQTPQGQSAEFTTTDRHYDDGVIHFIDEIPDAFYTWACSREIIITDTSRLGSYNDYIMYEMVTGTDGKWELPNNSYIQITDSTKNLVTALFYMPEAMPGIKYRLTITFAPETQLEQTEENARYFAPTAVRIGWNLPGQNRLDANYLNNPKPKTDETNGSFIISGMEVTTLTFSDFTGGNGNINLLIETNNRSPQVNNGTRCSILRIAEVRLTPQ